MPYYKLLIVVLSKTKYEQYSINKHLNYYGIFSLSLFFKNKQYLLQGYFEKGYIVVINICVEHISLLLKQ